MRNNVQQLMFINFMEMNCVKFEGRIVREFYAFMSKSKVSTKPAIRMNISQQKLTLRFLKYLETADNNNNESSRAIAINQDYLKNKYEKKIFREILDKESIKLLLKDPDVSEFRYNYKRICASFCRLIDTLSPSEILECLTLMLKLNPSRITFMKFYEISIDYLKQALQRDQLNLQQTLKLVYFCGLRKKKGARDVILVVKCLPPLRNLSQIEQSLVAETMYKCSIKLKKNESKFLEEIIEKNAETLVNESFALLPLCKAIRFAGPSKDFSMKNLSRALINAGEAFDITHAAHLTLLYAENHLKEINVLNPWFHDFWNFLKQFPRMVKIADVEKFLLAAAVLNYKIQEHHQLIISDFLQLRFKELKLKKHKFMNILLSLWMSGYQSKETIVKCFKDKIFENLVDDDITWKIRARRQLLITCISIEAPCIEIPEELKIPQDIGVKFDKNIRKIFKIMNSSVNNSEISQIYMNCPIHGIDIDGVSFTHKIFGKFHIDSLDERTCLRDSTEPHGLMNLKLRLLSQTGYQSILLTKEKLDENVLNFILEDLPNEFNCCKPKNIRLNNVKK